MFVFNVLVMFVVLTTVILSKALEDDGRGSGNSSNSVPDGYPFLVGMISNKFNDDHIVCTGTLITPNFVLSSAYCTLLLQPKIQLYHRTSSSTALEYRSAASVYCHPEYNSALRVKDLCLIKLVEPFSSVDDFVRLSSHVFKNNKTHLECVVTGIGMPHGHGYRMPVRVKYGPNACRIAESSPSLKYLINYTWPEFVCVTMIGKAGASTHPCDHGDPLVCRGNMQYGVFSYGYHVKATSAGALLDDNVTSECRDPSVQSRFMLVNKHTDWIAETVSMHTGDEGVDNGFRGTRTTTTTSPSQQDDPSTRPQMPTSSSSNTRMTTEAAVETFGEYAYLVYLTGAGADQPTCGGTLISPMHVLTSAYCTTKMSKIVVTMALNEKLYARASSVYVHPKFDLKTLAADISIVFLNEPLISIHGYVRFPNNSEQPIGNSTFEHECLVLSKRPQTPIRFEPVKVKYGVKACRKSFDSEIQTAVSQTWYEFSCGMLKNRFHGETGDPLICDGLLYGINSHAYDVQRPRDKGAGKQIRYLAVHNYGKWIDRVVMDTARSGAQRSTSPRALLAAIVAAVFGLRMRSPVPL